MILDMPRFLERLLPVLAAVTAMPHHAEAQTWARGLLGRPDAWISVGAGSSRVGPEGIRIDVSSAWAGVVSAPITLPRDAGKIAITVRLGGGGKLTVKLNGDLHGDGKQRLYSPAWGADIQGAYERPLDPRAIDTKAGHPVRLSLIIEGKPGAWGVISAIDFLPVHCSADALVAGQKSLPGVDMMPHLPQPYAMLEWRRVCRDFDRVAFDTHAAGRYLPLCKVSLKPDGEGRRFFSQSTYIADDRAASGAGESLNSLWALVSASVIGIDKERLGVDWVRMADAWYCSRNGLNLLTDYRNGPTALNFWYDLQPTMAYAMLVDLYPGRPEAERILRGSIDTLARVHDSLKGADEIPNYDFSGYEYDKRQPAATGSKEPDNAGCAAWLFYIAYRHFGDPAYLTRARECLLFWDRYGPVPFIETGLPWGALAAARMRAELGLNVPADRYIRRCFEFSHEGNEHVVIGADRWGDTDVSGMWEDPANKCYYVESCQWTMLVNIVRYDPGYARAMGRWMLNAANSLRLFFPSQLPVDCQTAWNWSGDPARAIPYERLNWGRHSKWLFACSDAGDYGWPVKDLSLYSGAATGFLGGRIYKTNVPGILKIDLLAFDTFHQPAYPTYLLYNPYAGVRMVDFRVGAGIHDVYDAAGKRWLARHVIGAIRLPIEGDRAVVAVITPTAREIRRDGGKLTVNGVVVDYAAGK